MRRIRIPTVYGALAITIVGSLLTLFIVQASETFALETEAHVVDPTDLNADFGH